MVPLFRVESDGKSTAELQTFNQCDPVRQQPPPPSWQHQQLDDNIKSTLMRHGRRFRRCIRVHTVTTWCASYEITTTQQVSALLSSFATSICLDPKDFYKQCKSSLLLQS